jgi:hypothetical protein
MKKIILMICLLQAYLTQAQTTTIEVKSGWQINKNCQLPNAGISIGIENKNIKTNTSFDFSAFHAQMGQSLVLVKYYKLESYIRYNWKDNKTSVMLLTGGNLPIKKTTLSLTMGIEYSNKVRPLFSFNIFFKIWEF